MSTRIVGYYVAPNMKVKGEKLITRAGAIALAKDILNLNEDASFHSYWWGRKKKNKKVTIVRANDEQLLMVISGNQKHGYRIEKL